MPCTPRSALSRATNSSNSFSGVDAAQRVGLRRNAQSRAGLFLHADINTGSGVFADANKDQAGHDAAGLKPRHPPGGFLVNLLSDGATVNKIAGWHQGIRSTDWMCKIGVRGQLGSRNSVPVILTRVPTKILNFLSPGAGCKYSIRTPVLISCNS